MTMAKAIGAVSQAKPAEWYAIDWQAIHRNVRRLQVRFAQAPQGSGPAFASGDVVDATDATGICSITKQPSLSP